MFLRKFYFLKSLCPENILRQIYFAFVHSRLNYGITCWGSTFYSNIKPIITIQKTYIRLIKSKGSRSESLKLFLQLGILPLRYMFVFKVLQMFFKISGNLGATIDRSARYAYKIKLPKAKTSFFQKTFIFLGPKFFNSLPRSIGSVQSPLVFYRQVKTWLLGLSYQEIEHLFNIIQ